MANEHTVACWRPGQRKHPRRTGSRRSPYHSAERLELRGRNNMARCVDDHEFRAEAYKIFTSSICFDKVGRNDDEGIALEDRLVAQTIALKLSDSAGEHEHRINPFLRTGEAAVVQAALARGAPGDDGVSVFAALREWKNNYR